MGSRAACWSRAAAGSPGHPGPVGEVAAGVQGVGVPGTVVLAVPVRGGDQREQVPGRRVAARVRALLKELEIS